MKIKELIAALSELDQDLEVFVSEYEGDYNLASIGPVIETYYNPDHAWYYGEYRDIMDTGHTEKCSGPIIKGVVL
jgi:hypothetical protein